MDESRREAMQITSPSLIGCPESGTSTPLSAVAFFVPGNARIIHASPSGRSSNCLSAAKTASSPASEARFFLPKTRLVFSVKEPEVPLRFGNDLFENPQPGQRDTPSSSPSRPHDGQVHISTPPDGRPSAQYLACSDPCGCPTQ